MNIKLTTSEAEEQSALYTSAYLSALQGMKFTINECPMKIADHARAIADLVIEDLTATVDAIRDEALEKEEQSWEAQKSGEAA